jgi:type II secretory ATPase GspE/PulE/Tfp pilus assembly ATPase PilB-like protein
MLKARLNFFIQQFIPCLRCIHVKSQIRQTKEQQMVKNGGVFRLTPGIAGLTEEQIQAAASAASTQGIPLHQALYNLGITDESPFLAEIAEKCGIEFIDLQNSQINDEILKQISANIASHYNVVPVRQTDCTLWLATSDPFFYKVKEEIEIIIDKKYRLVFVLATSDAIKKTIRKAYGLGAATVEQMSNGRNDRDLVLEKQDLMDEGKSKDASVIKLVNQILADAISAGATDIHIEPYEDELKAKYRIDGILHDAGIPQNVRFFREGLTSRVKIMSGLDIAEKRLPQDGRSQVNLGGQRYDLRISILPTRFGEAINIRILPQSRLITDLDSLGIPKREVELLTQLIARPHGIILVTGPTGSGKTTTLYTCMHMLRGTTRKIITIEDPIEYEMNGLVQMQVHPKIGFTFARALRSMLRHDPDIMLVGEIRDLETAETAIRTALTGHLVFSTLHTNDAASAITRLLDMGIEPFLAASSIDAILAQRLVRVICPHCKEPHKLESETAIAIKTILHKNNIDIFYHGKGCAKCRFTGFQGRTAITELIILSDRIREMTIARKHSNEIDSQAKKEGMISLFKAGIDKVRDGITTYQEVLRVTKGQIDTE